MDGTRLDIGTVVSDARAHEQVAASLPGPVHPVLRLEAALDDAAASPPATSDPSPATDAPADDAKPTWAQMNLEQKKAYMDEGTFAMPNPELPELGDFDALQTSKPQVVAFMVEVETEMAALLDTEPYDPQTHEGFGCGACHTYE